MRDNSALLSSAMDFIVPHLSRRDACNVQATCKMLWRDGFLSEVINRHVVSVSSSDKGFRQWLARRAHLVKVLRCGAVDLRALPLRALTTLTMRAPQMRVLALDLRALPKLTTLNLDGCAVLEALPGLEALTSLTSLDLGGCAALEALPELGVLTALCVLGLRGCTGLRELPSLEALTSLASLCLDGCTGLEALPALGVTRLTHLRLARCRASAGDLSACMLATDVSAMPGDAAGAQMVELHGGVGELPDGLCDLPLVSLVMPSCTDLDLPDDLLRLTGLRRLDLGGVITRVPDLSPLAPQLTQLCLSVSGPVPWLTSLRALQVLELRRCQGMTAPPPVGGLTQLRSLTLRGCERVRAFPDVRALTGLEALDLVGFAHATIPELTQLTRLTRLGLRGFRRAPALPPLVPSLKVMALHEFDALEVMSPLRLPALLVLDVRFATRLRQLPQMELPQLRALRVTNAPLLKTAPAIAHMHRMHTLDLSDTGLVHLPLDLDVLCDKHCLRSLRLARCRDLRVTTTPLLRWLVNERKLALHVL